MSILSSLARYAERYRFRRRQARTLRKVMSLPLEIRKDIGWDMTERAKGDGAPPRGPAG